MHGAGRSPLRELLFVPTSAQERILPRPNAHTLDYIVGKHLTEAEQDARRTFENARANPKLVKSGNNKLRAVYGVRLL